MVVAAVLCLRIMGIRVVLIRRSSTMVISKRASTKVVRRDVRCVLWLLLECRVNWDLCFIVQCGYAVKQR